MDTNQWAETTLHYRFRNSALLHQALTHPSYSNEHNTQHYQRLEFLGDSVISMVVATHLYQKFPKADEGQLTKLRSSGVCTDSLAEIAQSLHITDHIHIGHGAAISNHVLEDMVESLVGAIYLDGGILPAQRFIETHIIPAINNESTQRDYKTTLQVKLQQNQIHPVYQLIGTHGPDHSRVFDVAVYAGSRMLARGSGTSKKQAEQEAARIALGA